MSRRVELVSAAKRLNRIDPTRMGVVEARNMKAAEKAVNEIIASVLKDCREKGITDPLAIQRIVSRYAAAWGEPARRIALQRIDNALKAGLSHSNSLLKVLGLEAPEQTPFMIRKNAIKELSAQVENDYSLLQAELQQRLSSSVIEAVQVSGKGSAEIIVREATAKVVNHAKQIASAETLNPFRLAQTSQYELVGVTIGEWVTREDEMVCDYCSKKHGKRYPLDRWPESHPHCRCDIAPVVDAEIYRVTRRIAQEA